MADDFTVNGSPPEEVESRTFTIAAAGLGGLIVLSLICLGLYALVLAPRQREAMLEAPDRIATENAGTAAALTATREAELATATPEPTETSVPPTATSTATATQVIVLPTDTPTLTPFTTLATLIPETATAAAAMTQTAEAIAGGAVTETPTPEPTPTALPTAGFADEVGLPGLLFLGGALLVVVFLSRRLRASASPG